MRKEVIAFSEDMERKLCANDNKGGWSTCELTWLLRRLREETGELAGAIGALMHADLVDMRAQFVIDEAADVANFAMMIADNARRLTREAE